MYLTSLFFTSHLCIVGSCLIQVSLTCRKRRTTAATRSHGKRASKRARVLSDDDSDSDALDSEDFEEFMAQSGGQEVLHRPRQHGEGSSRSKKRAKPAAKKKGKPPTKTRARPASKTRAKPKPAAYCSFIHSFIKPLSICYFVFISISLRHYLNFYSCFIHHFNKPLSIYYFAIIQTEARQNRGQEEEAAPGQGSAVQHRFGVGRGRREDRRVASADGPPQ